MGAWVHRLLEKDVATMSGVCTTCGPVKLKRKGLRYLCRGSQVRRAWRGVRRGYRTRKLSVCARCGFVPEDPCQMDVDHIDGDHQNNDPANLQTLCANCHRLKTKAAGDGIYRFHPPVTLRG